MIIFYDILQKLVLRIIKLSFFKQAIAENKNKIQALENITQASLYKLTEEFYKVAEVKSNSK